MWHPCCDVKSKQNDCDRDNMSDTHSLLYTWSRGDSIDPGGSGMLIRFRLGIRAHGRNDCQNDIRNIGFQLLVW